jgi:hypothetical protein
VGIVAVQLLPVVGLVSEDVAVKSKVMTETSASELELIVIYLVAELKFSHVGFEITLPFFL